MINLQKCKMHQVRGRGTIIEVDSDNYPNHEFSLGDIVSYDGKTYLVYGMEMIAHLTYPLQYSSKIGLQVKPYDIRKNIDLDWSLINPYPGARDARTVAQEIYDRYVCDERFHATDVARMVLLIEKERTGSQKECVYEPQDPDCEIDITKIPF